MSKTLRTVYSLLEYGVPGEVSARIRPRMTDSPGARSWHGLPIGRRGQPARPGSAPGACPARFRWRRHLRIIARRCSDISDIAHIQAS